MTAAPETFSSKTAADRWLAASASSSTPARQSMSARATAAVGVVAGLLALSACRTSHGRRPAMRLPGVCGSNRASARCRCGGSSRRTSTTGSPSMIEQGVSASKVIESVGVLKRVLDRAVRDKAIPANPCDQRSIDPAEAAEDGPAGADPCRGRVAGGSHAASRPTGFSCACWPTAACGSARRSALRWTDVDLTRTDDDDPGERRGHDGQDHRRTDQDLRGTDDHAPGRARGAARQPVNGTDKSGTDSLLVFPNRQRRLPPVPELAARRWDKACERSGVTALPHDLRATCASLLIDAGASPKDVQAHLGHEDITTTMHLYARVRPGRSADIAARLDALIAEAG